MNYRYGQLKELVHSLGRARAIAEELRLIHLANTLTHNLGVIHNEIQDLEKLRQPASTTPKVQPRRKSKALGSDNEDSLQETTIPESK